MNNCYFFEVLIFFTGSTPRNTTAKTRAIYTPGVKSPPYKKCRRVAAINAIPM